MFHVNGFCTFVKYSRQSEGHEDLNFVYADFYQNATNRLICILKFIESSHKFSEKSPVGNNIHYLWKLDNQNKQKLKTKGHNKKDASTHHNFPKLKIFSIPHLSDIVEEYRKLRKVHSKGNFGKESLNFKSEDFHYWI